MKVFQSKSAKYTSVVGVVIAFLWLAYGLVDLLVTKDYVLSEPDVRGYEICVTQFASTQEGLTLYSLFIGPLAVFIVVAAIGWRNRNPLIAKDSLRAAFITHYSCLLLLALSYLVSTAILR